MGWYLRQGRVVQMLMGSKSQDILRCQLEQLSTYGILKEHGTAFTNALIRSLIDVGLLRFRKGIPLVDLNSVVRRRQVLVIISWCGQAKSSPLSDDSVQMDDLRLIMLLVS